MSELIPVTQATRLRRALSEYLGTTFSLADPETRAALEDFLTDREHGMFRGPYVRLRLPFRPAEDGWRDSLEWYEGFPPYGHQARAFARLSSLGLTPDQPRPQPTLVTTGTGSGKTEAFLYPILDHVRRARRQGIRGTKAIILYPMNALADDQAGRLAALIAEHAELADITAALYTGQEGPERSKVSAAGLITSREVIRDQAPDILLTNYKMLDQLLLRDRDARIWQQSATSLQYLVLDEFHTYDGAQGTDVSMLLRRLGLTLKSYWTDDGPALTEEDHRRPLGRVTPVATSATLGDGDSSTMRDFAETVFGEAFPPEAVITESRLSVTEWSGDAAARIGERGWAPMEFTTLTAFDPDRDEKRDVPPEEMARLVLAAMYRTPDGNTVDLTDAEPTVLLDLVKAHPFTERLVDATRSAADLHDLAHALVPRGQAENRKQAQVDPVAALSRYLAALSHVRATCGRAALSVDTHLWTRELTRLDRMAAGSPTFAWSDDGVLTGAASGSGTGVMLPAIYCRHCHRSGWGVILAPTGSDLDTDDTDIRRRHLAGEERFRSLLHAPEEDQRARDEEATVSNLAWFLVEERRLVVARPDKSILDAGGALPVLTHRGEDAGKDSKEDVCPSCLQKDGIRFLGSAIATMLSVNLSALFGTDGLDEREKKALVFTDSVQDAAHRAGFIQARSHSLTLRSVLRHALPDDEPVTIPELVRAVLEGASDNPHHRYRILPPDLADRDKFAEYWRPHASSTARASARRRVEKRLTLDVMLEVGLRSGVGRTLERTGTAVANVDVAPQLLAQVAREAIDAAGGTGTLDTFAPTEKDLLAWVRGVLERMRTRGAIEHDWFTKFRRADGNRWAIWGGRPRHEGMPAFPAGASAPGYPRIGGAPAAKDSDMDPLGSPRGWYATWTGAVLNVDNHDGATLVRHLFTRLDQRGILGVEASDSQATTYHLRPESIVVRAAQLDELTSGCLALACDTCHDITPGAPETVDQLDGAPCLVQRCTGRLVRHRDGENFYRQMYAGHDIRRIIAREHTSLLPDKTRLAYEQQFKAPTPAPDAPNVLVATPTLEMGIDIGDLSAVVLASLPRTVASYVQRVGRAGRLTGNSLALAFVTARGDQLPRFTDPLGTINGEVRPPATYLGAEEILRRQYLACIADVLARRPDAPHPARVDHALSSSDPGTYLGEIIDEAETHAEAHLARFLGAFATLGTDAVASLREWATPTGGPGTSAIAARCHAAAREWQHRLETLQFRRQEIERSLPELRQKADLPAATETDQRELRTAEAALRLTNHQLADLRGEYWISALEEAGLFPNYTLLDDSVKLDVAISWIDPDTQQHQRDAVSIERASAQALRDFAPGSTFYARGLAIDIDAVELGRDGEDVRTWAVCPACGYSIDLGPDGGHRTATACARCGSPGIADLRQRVDVVELREVSSAIRREEATINDNRDERDRTSYQVVLATQHTADHVRRRWYVQDYDFGANYVRDMTLRWLNLGPRSSRGSAFTFAGREVNAPKFRLCDSCGKKDSATGRNSPHEHRPWCPRRREQGEHTRSLALGRTLRTEGLLLRLPRTATLGDQFAVPSLRAALMLALREHLGGAPDHLAVETVVDPAADGTPLEALLLHDIVPGGTGYLAELADPATVWGMLHTAWRLLRDCTCQEDDKLACDRCLLPFAGVHEVRYVSRAAAERHLRTILLSGKATDDAVPEAMSWTVTEEEPAAPDKESQLEQKFRQVLRTRLDALGATVVEQPTDVGNAWQITFGGGARWRLEPQQFLHGARPDFVLSSDRPNIPGVAIFTDGWGFHAAPDRNRLADDAHKRDVLRQAGYQVLALTWEDVEGAETERPSEIPAWFEPDAVPMVLQTAGDGLRTASVDLARRGPLDQLVQWVQSPDVVAREQLARWLPLFTLPRAESGTSDASTPLARVALEALDGGSVGGGGASTFVWRRGAVAFGMRLLPGNAMAFETALVLDDAADVLGPDHRQAWRTWLHLANLLNHRTEPSVVTTRSALGKQVAVPVRAPQGDLRWSPAWEVVFSAAADDAERDLLRTLAPLDAGGLPAPVLGEEVDTGDELIPLDLSWPGRRVAIVGDSAVHADLERMGWQVVSLDVDRVRDVLTDGGGR
ncbi:DEAD/DEAH box helicase [Ruania suaedae]|uniref:DEAD/DEAH box helicase n=1 Tax=Ruania suaedae TaxID=2897774 RepID=UPI001E3B3A47|nr:DEAD/DEAH box helicase [Ruania suaedae]UFU01872.1 DEAD/DEAH box helicase [Ruania suaedae]